MATENEIDIEEMDDISQVQDDAGAAQVVEKPEASASSTEQDVSNTVSDDDTLSIVRDVVDKTAAPEAAASSAKSEEVGLADAQIPTAKQDNENYSDVPFNKHPRFQAVLSDLKEAKKHAELSLNIENFLDESGLEREEAADGLRLMAMAKTDPVKAWAELRPWVETVIRAAGEVLPDDIKAMVEQGQMTHDAAIMLSRQRAQTQSMEARQSFAERRAARQREFDAKNEAEAGVVRLQNTAVQWVEDRSTKDPNFDAKLPLIVEEVKRLQSMGWMPQTEEAVAEQLRRAYSSVNAKALRAAPPQNRRPETRPITGGQVNGATRVAPPTSTMGIIQAEVAKRQAG